MFHLEPLTLFFHIQTTPPCGTDSKFAEGSNILAPFLQLQIYKALCACGSLKSVLIPKWVIIAVGGGAGHTGCLPSQMSHSLR